MHGSKRDDAIPKVLQDEGVVLLTAAFTGGASRLAGFSRAAASVLPASTPPFARAFSRLQSIVSTCLQLTPL